ncbi:ferrochelatase [Aliidiomarina taiwanensis]|uniref:Ferrochelatase n=1 Tax=Aliidiomarina taiwanensis TaxID=946228 RepID=A0A432X1Q3_9GAMM|nr:ferrochelatase [Aliidiomarina taiwanensis]RUO40101.1 ferrochelatase [Aliidiomarina taiwanensis]
MTYKGRSNFEHGERGKIGVLLLNLGTPDAPTTPALRRYLGEFLADPRVVEVPRFLWRIILHGVILRIRPARSAKAYRTVWTEQGSPLLIHTQHQAEALAAHFQAHSKDDIEVSFAMRYGNPSVSSGIEDLLGKGVRKLLVLPLYPQYSGSTTASTFDAVANDFKQRRWLPDLRFVSHYHDHPAYIKAVAESIRQHQEAHGKPDKLVFSYHGVPKKYLLKGDPYHCECYKTSRLVATELGLGDEEYITTFQSRFGREEWLQPYTDKTLQGLPAQGVKHIQVVCPGFAADCLETIEEIDIENREYFLEAGGETFEYIPCLNATPEHIQALASIIEEQLQGWSAQTVAEADETKQNFQRLNSGSEGK